MIAVDLPAGGSPRLSHDLTAAIDEAVAFLLAAPPIEHLQPRVLVFREMFGLTAMERCEAIRGSQR